MRWNVKWLIKHNSLICLKKINLLLTCFCVFCHVCAVDIFTHAWMSGIQSALIPPSLLAQFRVSCMSGVPVSVVLSLMAWSAFSLQIDNILSHCMYIFIDIWDFCVSMQGRSQDFSGGQAWERSDRAGGGSGPTVVYFLFFYSCIKMTFLHIKCHFRDRLCVMAWTNPLPFPPSFSFYFILWSTGWGAMTPLCPLSYTSVRKNISSSHA